MDWRILNSPHRPSQGQTHETMSEFNRAELKRLGAWFAETASTEWGVFYRSGCKHTCAVAYAALELAGAAQEKLDRFASCRTKVYLYRHRETGIIRTRVNTCGLRWCPLCRRGKAQHTAATIRLHMHAAAKRLRFVTLTQRALPDEPLPRAYARLCASLTRFLKDPWWQAHSKGGAVVVEITRAKSVPNAWHVHAHAVVEGEYLDCTTLSNTWARASRVDVAHTRIEAVREIDQAAHYLSKYLTKPVDNEVAGNVEHLAEAMKALRSRKTTIFFGTWRGDAFERPLRDAARSPRNDEPHDTWIFLGELGTIVAAAQRGDSRSLDLLDEAGFGSIPRSLLIYTAGPGPPTPAATQQSAPLFAYAAAGA